jgi:two-component system, cell cycle sensor histidine kinase and response regulator CckA
MAPGAAKTILVVADEPLLRGLIATALRKAGYSTIEARDGQEGLQQFRNLQRKVDLILTDVSMPRMTGPEMVQRILEIDPSVGVLFMSDTGIESMLICLGKKSLLSKPFTVQGLIDSVEGCLATCT